MNEVIYNYFKDNDGLAKGLDDHIKYLENKYSGLTKNQLKKHLRYLKGLNRGDHDISSEIQFLSRLIRSHLTKNRSESSSFEKFDHDHEIQRGFWSYVKRVIDVKEVISPIFNKDTCSHYFRKIFKRTVDHEFTLPSWIPEFPEPTKVCF